MAYFLVLADDRADALDERIAHRQEHIDYWTGKPGVVKVAGAMLDGDRPCGSSFLLEADDEAEARGLVAQDPFTKHGIFAGTTQVFAMRPAIGEWLPKA
jgi:uncharacterized protein YciI